MIAVVDLASLVYEKNLFCLEIVKSSFVVTLFCILGITLQDLLLYYSNKSKYEDDSENEDDNDKEKKRRISLMVWSNNDELDKVQKFELYC